MRFHSLLLIITAKVMMRSYCPVQACGLNWSSSFMHTSTLSDDVSISLFHPAMQINVDLVENFTYHVSLSLKHLKSAQAVFLVIYGEDDNADDIQEKTRGSSCSSNITMHAHEQHPLDVAELACMNNAEEKPLQMSYLWTSSENLPCNCLSITPLILVSDRGVRGRAFNLCKPTGCRHYHTELAGRLLYNSSSPFAHRHCDVVTYVIIGISKSLIEAQYLEFGINNDGTCDNSISISLGEVIQTPFCETLTTQQLRRHYYTSDSGRIVIGITINNKQRPALFSVVFNTYTRDDRLEANQISGYISSPNFPHQYPSSIHKISTFIVLAHAQVQVYLLFLDLGNTSQEDCSNDTVVIKDLVTNIIKIISCSKEVTFDKNDLIFQSDSSQFQVEFHSDDRLQGNGFKFFYKTTTLCPNHTATKSSTGEFSSPNYPFNYPNSEECFFSIHVDEHNNLTTLNIQFIYFHTESNREDSMYRNRRCISDFLEINSKSRRERICGNWGQQERLLTFRGLRAPVWFRFVSNKQQTRSGFFARWEKVNQTQTGCTEHSFDQQLVRFLFVCSPQVWQDSDLDCRSRGGVLATFDDLTVYRLIELHLTSSQYNNESVFWIGANDINTESVFVGTDGDNLTFSRWFPGWPMYNNYNQQPSDDGLSNEDCVEIRRQFHLPCKGMQDTGGYFWNDRDCRQKNPFICKIDLKGAGYINKFGGNDDNRVGSCSTFPCVNDSHCHDVNDSSATCQCLHAYTGSMCTPRLEGGNRETLGQRLLKEPIWIGLIVILSVIALFGVVYVLRRRCGTLFVCYEDPRTKDDNILNANGTITLNSFPLKSLTRPSISVISLSSPVFPRGPHVKRSSTPCSTPGVKIWNAAAKFFASYSDTERSLVALPLTMDFSRTTDTSLSQVIGDASVGAVVGGKLQLDLHIRENKEREDMSRASSLVQIADTSNNSGNFEQRQDMKRGQFLSGSSHSFNEYGQTISSALEHIYPFVVVQSPQWGQADACYQEVGGNQDSNELECVDSSAAHVIQVNLEDDSDGSGGLDMSKSNSESDINVLPIWKLHYHSIDYIHQPQDTGNDSIDRNIGKSCNSIDRADAGARQQAFQQSNGVNTVVKNKFITSSTIHKNDTHSAVVKSRSTSNIPNGGISDDDWKHAFRKDAGKSRPGRKPIARSARLNPRCEQLFGNQLCGPQRACANVGHWNQSTCRCLVCSLNRSDSLTSTISSASTGAPPSRDRITCQKKPRRKQIKYPKSTSTNYEHSSAITQRKTRKGCSHRYKHWRMKQGSVGKSLVCIQGKFSSSTDSDFINWKRQCNRCQTQDDKHDGDSQLTSSVRGSQATMSSVLDQTTPASDNDVKDFFQTVFSQEIDLDDFSLLDDDDASFMSRTKLNSKDSILASKLPCFYCPENDERDAENQTMETILGANSMSADGSQPAYPSLNNRRNSVVIMLAGRPERISVVKSESLDVQQRGCLNSSGSCGTPTTCNVIVYDTNKRLDNTDAPPTARSDFRLTRKHSSLDLVQPLKLLNTSHQPLRTTSSMQELCNQTASAHEANLSANKLESSYSRSTCSFLDDCELSKQVVYMPLAVSEKGNKTDDNFVRKDTSKRKNMKESNKFTSISSTEKFSPQALGKRMKSSYVSSVIFGSRQYLSITDTDSAMSSAASPRVNYGTCPNLHDATHEGDSTLQDSAYQTKQSSVEKENNPDTRMWRPMTPLREEDTRVTQRLHQAAQKLLIIQQRFGRAKHNLSKDSAVHVISDDDTTLDDVTVISAQIRSHKPEALHSVKQPSQPGKHEFSPLHCAKIDDQEVPRQMWLKNPDRVHMVSDKIYRPNWFESDLLFNKSLYPWRHNYAVHVWSASNYPVPEHIQDITSANTTVAQIFRYVLYED